MKTNFTVMKMRFCLFAVSFFGFINLSNAQVVNWTGGVDSNFYNEKNWDKTTIDFTNLGETILIIGAGTPNNPINLGYKGPEKMTKRPSSLTTNADANIIVTGTFYSNGICYLNGKITVDNPSAEFGIRNSAYLGKNAIGILNINTGKASTKSNFFIGNGTGGDGLLTVNTGASLDVGTTLEIGTGSGDPTGNLKIKGGTVTVYTTVNIGVKGHISISGAGKLIVMGNKEEVLKAYVKSRTIGCTVGKSLEVVFDGTKTTVSIKETAAK